MSQFDYDLFVIGAGSGGVRASRMAAQLGKRVAIAEEWALGGTCVNVGCVPKKLFVYGSHFSEDFEAAAGYGWSVEKANFHWPTLRNHKTAEIERLNGIYESLLHNARVDIIRGRATITGPNSVRVGNSEYRVARILVATGGRPRKPSYPGAALAISSNEAFYLEAFPKTVLVEGGGYIAVEFAGIFNGLGAKTELVYRGAQILRGFDEDVRHFTAEEVAKKGVRFRFDNGIHSIEKQTDGRLRVSFINGENSTFDVVLSAIGRVPLTEGLGLETTQVRLNERGAIIVDDNLRTHEPSIYALGDVVGRKELTPVALAEGMALVRHLYQGETPLHLDYSNIATAVFSQPNIATVGLTEHEARDIYDDVDIYTTRFRHMKYTLTDIPERTFMKLVVDRQTQRVLGCHMVGPDAGEIIQGLAIAIKAGATKATFDSTVGIHPTAAEEFVTMRQKTR